MEVPSVDVPPRMSEDLTYHVAVDASTVERSVANMRRKVVPLDVEPTSDLLKSIAAFDERKLTAGG